MTERDLFLAALDIENLEDRARFLAEQCVGEPAKLQRLQNLLLAKSAAGDFLEIPAGLPEVGLRDATHSLADPNTTGSHIPEVVQEPIEREGTVIAGRYKLRQQIGEGGMGTVWMADQTEPVKRKVAVKLIRVERGQSKTILARFEAERQAIALMDHPHIAKLLDAGTTETGSPFFVMELVKGIPLNDFCDEHKLTIQERLNLFQQICSAVQHAHQKGIIHRDLKPSNILVESHDGKPVPKVIDFGLAKATTGLQLSEQSMYTAFGSVMGTPLYMAPEQATFNAVDVDTRADVYALGVILYELLTGTTPLTKETMKKAALDEMLRLVREQEAPTPSSRLSSADSSPSVAASRQIEPAKLGRFVKGELDWIVLKALAKERDRRYETANGFARDIERFLNHEPVTAGPPSARYRLRKFVRRNRPQVIASMLVLLALVAGVVGTIVGLLEARRQTAFAREQETEAKKQEAEAVKQAGIAQANEGLANTRLQEVEAEKRKVEAEKKRADEEKQVALAVTDFLQNKLLAQADTLAQAETLLKAGLPAADAKLNPTIRELLDRAAKELAPDKIEANFPKQPLVQAQILHTVGEAYSGIGESATGLPFLVRSWELFKTHFGPDHPHTITCMHNLAKCYDAAGKIDKALPLYEETLKLMKAQLGPDHPDTLASMNSLAVGYQTALKLDKAVPLLEESLKLTKAKLGPDHPNTLSNMNNLAEGYRREGKLDNALPLFEETLKLRKARLGPDHPNTLASMNNLAGGYKDAGKFDLALPLDEETLRLSKTKLGPDHPDTLKSMNNLAANYLATGKFDRALPLFEETFALTKSKLGPDHPRTLAIMANLAGGYQAVGNLTKALPLFEETLQLRKAEFPSDHPDTLDIMANLAVGYQAAGKLDKALPLLEDVLKLLKAKLGPDHPDTRQTAEYLMFVRRLQNADNHYRRELAARGPKDIKTLLALRDVAQFHIITGQLDLAEPQLAEVLDGLTARESEDPIRLFTVGLMRQCLVIREKKEPDVWTTFNTKSLLGGALLGKKNYAEAEPLLVKGYEGMKTREKTIPPHGASRIPEALDRLIAFYTATDNLAELKKYQDLRAKYPMPRELAPPLREKK